MVRLRPARARRNKVNISSASQLFEKWNHSLASLDFPASSALDFSTATFRAAQHGEHKPECPLILEHLSQLQHAPPHCLHFPAADAGAIINPSWSNALAFLRRPDPDEAKT
jgi:hypothetical protein